MTCLEKGAPVDTMTRTCRIVCSLVFFVFLFFCEGTGCVAFGDVIAQLPTVVCVAFYLGPRPNDTNFEHHFHSFAW